MSKHLTRISLANCRRLFTAMKLTCFSSNKYNRSGNFKLPQLGYVVSHFGHRVAVQTSSSAFILHIWQPFTVLPNQHKHQFLHRQLTNVKSSRFFYNSEAGTAVRYAGAMQVQGGKKSGRVVEQERVGKVNLRLK